MYTHQERRRDLTANPVNLKKLALGALNPIEKKLQGIESERQVSVSNQVEKLIQDASSHQKLVSAILGAGYI